MRRSDRELPQPPAKDRPNRPWLCGQLGHESACDTGPDTHGKCPLRHVCKPTRTWQGKRRPWIVASFAVSIVLVALVMAYPVNTAWIKPGELSTPHAQILSAAIESERCATCHPSASSSTLSWFFSAGEAHDGVDQTERCLKCHHTLASSSLARSAHNVPAATRNLIRLASLARNNKETDFNPVTAHENQDNLDCAVCHQEHHGPDADLLSVSDARCQTCHSTTFSSFSTNHPGWESWPYGNGGEIGFDHAKHFNRHFPASKLQGAAVEFRCDMCHSQNSQGEITRTNSYESSCAACHDESLQLANSEGIELVSLPMLPADLAELEQDWPSRATGFLDGGLSPLAELLLKSDPAVQAAIQILPSRDFSQARLDNALQRTAAISFAKGTKSLLSDIASLGQNSISRRAHDVGVNAATLDDFLRGLSPQLVADTLKLWFDESPAEQVTENLNTQEAIESPSDQLLLGNDLLLADAPHGDPLVREELLGGELLKSNEVLAPNTRSFDAASMMPAGGWYRDDVRLAIRYRGMSHADATLRATIEIVAQIPPGDAVRDRILAVSAIKSCVECHPSATSAQPSWVSLPRVGRTDLFTKFSHAPHLNIAQLSDCKQCHQIAPVVSPVDSPNGASPVATRGWRKVDALEVLTVSHSGSTAYDIPIDRSRQATKTPNDFEPLDKESCTGCHTPQASNDSCTTCHRYHIR